MRAMMTGAVLNSEAAAEGVAAEVELALALEAAEAALEVAAAPAAGIRHTSR